MSRTVKLIQLIVENMSNQQLWFLNSDRLNSLVNEAERKLL